MLTGSRSHRPSRQCGRYNESKDKRSNRKPNKKTKADSIEIGKEMASVSCVADVGNSTDEHLKDVEVPVVQPPTDKQKYIKNMLSVDKTSMSAHDLVIDSRPKPKPSWHLQQMAFTPSRSYVGKTRSDDEKNGGEQDVPDDTRGSKASD